jgi:hypothetical protein
MGPTLTIASDLLFIPHLANDADIQANCPRLIEGKGWRGTTERWLHCHASGIDNGRNGVKEAEVYTLQPNQRRHTPDRPVN